MIILTELKQTGPERFLARFDNDETVRTTLNVVTDLGLYSGKALSDEEFDQIQNASSLALCKQRALRIIGARPLSRKELRDRLKEKGESAENAEMAVEWLTDLRLLDDEQYAAAVVRHYTVKGYGAGRIRAELAHRGVDRDYWDEALAFASGSDDKLISYIRSHLRDPDDRDQKRKVSAALYRRGYSWDEIRSALSRFSSGSEDDYE